MTKKREVVRKTYTFDRRIIAELEDRKLLTGTPVCRLLENSWKKCRDEIKVNV